MRVIAGLAKGRSLKAVPGMGTRPTTDKVKEALFSMIGPFFEGGTALDLFAGTGGLGIEALSRGMQRAVFIDADKQSIDIIKANVQAAGFSNQVEIYRNEAERALKALHKRGMSFELVFLDPPYRMKNMDELMVEMIRLGLIVEEAVIVVEHDSSHQYNEQIGDCSQIKYSRYGETAVSIYRYSPRADEDGGDTHD